MVETALKVGTRAATEYALDDSVGYMLSVTDRRMIPFLKMCLSTEGISYGMWYFLRVLWEQDGLSQKEMAYRTGLTQPTSVEAVRNMKRRGLIRIADDPKDGRQMKIFLTQAGRDMKSKLLPKVAKINDIALAGISDADFIFMRKILRKIRANIDNNSPEALLSEIQ
jgi:DNA-binding MarR family transcriptional regulator